MELRSSFEDKGLLGFSLDHALRQVRLLLRPFILLCLVFVRVGVDAGDHDDLSFGLAQDSIVVVETDQELPLLGLFLPTHSAVEIEVLEVLDEGRDLVIV